MTKATVFGGRGPPCTRGRESQSSSGGVRFPTGTAVPVTLKAVPSALRPTDCPEPWLNQSHKESSSDDAPLAAPPSVERPSGSAASSAASCCSSLTGGSSEDGSSEAGCREEASTASSPLALSPSLFDAAADEPPLPPAPSPSPVFMHEASWAGEMDAALGPRPLSPSLAKEWELRRVEIRLQLEAEGKAVPQSLLVAAERLETMRAQQSWILANEALGRSQSNEVTCAMRVICAACAACATYYAVSRMRCLLSGQWAVRFHFSRGSPCGPAQHHNCPR